MHSISRKNRKMRTAATATEFAIVAPVFIVFLLAAFEFGWMNVLRHTADNAAYEAARTALVPGATVAEAQAKADKLLKIVGARSATVTVTPSPLTVDSDSVTVKIEVPMNKNGLIVPRFTKKSTIVATSTLRTERPE
jgi:Flp pilus assembly protein TadG